MLVRRKQSTQSGDYACNIPHLLLCMSGENGIIVFFFSMCFLEREFLLESHLSHLFFFSYLAFIGHVHVSFHGMYNYRRERDKHCHYMTAWKKPAMNPPCAMKALVTRCRVDAVNCIYSLVFPAFYIPQHALFLFTRHRLHRRRRHHHRYHRPLPLHSPATPPAPCIYP